MSSYSCRAVLQKTHELALEFLERLDQRPVGRPVDFAGLVESAVARCRPRAKIQAA